MILILKFLVPRGYRGITLYPFILLLNADLKENVQLINHEKIHLRQQLEMLVLPFYLWYSIEFLLKLIRFRKWHLAYLNISFEREAYQNEKDLNYLKSRPLWSFTRYL